jgi:hypothetical protein
VGFEHFQLRISFLSLVFVGVDLFLRGHRAAHDPRRDDCETYRKFKGGERRQGQDHQEGWVDQAVVEPA